jgi:P27 family predicted phage terminase small subunit
LAIRGQKPKPSYLRAIDGGAGHRPLNEDEPKPPGKLLEPPAFLSDSQRDLWFAKLADVPPGMLTRIDASVFTNWVVACDLYDQALRKVNEYGLLVKAPITGTPMQSPALSILNRQARDISKFASELGFTPTSRTRVKVDRRTKKQSPFGELKELGD